MKMSHWYSTRQKTTANPPLVDYCLTSGVSVQWSRLNFRSGKFSQNTKIGLVLPVVLRIERKESSLFDQETLAQTTIRAIPAPAAAEQYTKVIHGSSKNMFSINVIEGIMFGVPNLAYTARLIHGN